MRVDDPGSSKGSLDCRKEEYKKYCNGGKKKSDEEIQAMHPWIKENQKSDKTALDKMFDPWNGLFYGTSTTRNDGLDVMWFAVDDLYSSLGIDFDTAAMNGQPNPLTFDDINNNETTRLVIPALIGRANYIPYQMFLIQIGMPHDIHDSITNYEPQYLAALMKYFPRELDFAKQEYARIFPDAYNELIQDWRPGPLGPLE